jgi:HTH-type transcriptional regulator / antitoxin HigA
MEKGAVMKTTGHKMIFAEMPQEYSGLVAMFPPRPIHDSADYDSTMEVVQAMAGHELNRDQEDYLLILSELILHYDREHERPRRRGTPQQRLKYLVEEANLSASALGRLLGSRGMGSLILNGKRGLSKTHIKKLSEYFKVSTDYFM